MPSTNDSLPADRAVSRVEEDRVDGDLMARIRAGDVCAFERLLQRYWTRLVEYALTFAVDPDGAEDMVQETFMRVWERRERWRPMGSVRSFLYLVVRNEALQARRRDSVRGRWARAQVRDRSSSPSPAELFEAGELGRTLMQAIDALPPRRREILTLARFHGLSYREIAGIMDISPQTVANQMSAALAELRRAIPESLRPQGLAQE